MISVGFTSWAWVVWAMWRPGKVAGVVVRPEGGELVLEGECNGCPNAVAAMGALCRRRGIWLARGAAGCAVVWDVGGGKPEQCDWIGSILYGGGGNGSCRFRSEI